MEFGEEGLEDVYSDFEDGLEDDELTPAEAAFMRGYMDQPEEIEE